MRIETNSKKLRDGHWGQRIAGTRDSIWHRVFGPAGGPFWFVNGVEVLRAR